MIKAARGRDSKDKVLGELKKSPEQCAAMTWVQCLNGSSGSTSRPARPAAGQSLSSHRGSGGDQEDPQSPLSSK